MKEFVGVYRAIVVDNVDPEGLGRVGIRLPQSTSPAASDGVAWARIATLMAGPKRGTWFMPDVNDEVLIAFEGGDRSLPFVLGALWSSASPPPETLQRGNDRKLIRSRNGLQVTLNDDAGHESITIDTPMGQSITLSDGPGAVVLKDSNGNSVALGADGVVVKAALKVTVDAGVVEINAPALSVNASTATFSGVVQCDVLISNSVNSASYTPGAGNVW
jgi:uncharacterized protein involved in type VI secretion and phage assembly